MIRPPGFRGAAFGAALEGNGRDREPNRQAISEQLGIPSDWAHLRQVHGDAVIRAGESGRLGDADALFSTVPMLPLAVATADCYPVVLEADGAAGIAHAGWRGVIAGTVIALREVMVNAGAAPVRAAVGPGIGGCCFEVGPEIAARFPGLRRTTTWGTGSVDLLEAIIRQLEGLEVWTSGVCTYCGSGYYSYRRDGTDERQVAVAWVA